MIWSVINFGTHKGKTLPQVLFSDPDWFFWAIEEGVFQNRGTLRGQAADLNTKARHIKVPARHGTNMLVEYVIHPPTGKFAHIELVPASQPHHDGSSPTFRKSEIDLSIPRQIAQYDKLGCKNMLKSAKFYLFGSERTRMTKERCEEFFDDVSNFIRT